MQNCPLAAVKIHAKQTRDGNNRRDGVGVGGTDGELDSQSEEERGNEFLAVKTQVSVSRVCCRKKNGSKGWLVVVVVSVRQV